MISVKTLLFTVFGLYFIAFAFLLHDGYSKRKIPSLNNLFRSIKSEQTSNPVYRFENPTLAYKVLSQLDVYKRVDDYVKYYSKSYLGFKRDDEYCEKHRAYFVQNPESLFENMNIVHAWATDHFVATTVSSFANDLHHENTKQLEHRTGESFIYDVQPEANAFFTSSPLAFYYDLNKHLSCLSQESNHIPGSGKLARRDVVAQAAMIYMTKYENRPRCLSYDKLFPQTWSLSDPAQCEVFFRNINTSEYARLQEERKIVYIKKRPSAHGGVGVWPLHKEEETRLRNEYQEGALCGKLTENIIMQHYIHNSLLLDGHKFDFRMYMLIASVNPLIVYYHDGFLRVTLAKYDPNSTDNKLLLTNLQLVRQIYDDGKKGNQYEGISGEDLKNSQHWSMERLQTYLLNAGVISDPNWLDNYLRPEFKKAMIHLVRLSSDGFSKHSSFYGLCGVDFMLDTNLNLWFIEANPSSSFYGYSKLMMKFISKMLKDHFEVVFGLLRSRMKRVVLYVNDLTENDIAYETVGGELVIEDLEERRQMFENITKNSFEKEFEVNKENGFSKIIDENDVNDVYQGLIEEDCL